MSNVAINILAEFTGKRAFDKAGKATNTLEQQVGKLGKQMAVVFSATALTSFAKSAVNAFMEAEKANQRLATVVKNLGLAFETAGIQQNLDEISAKTGIAGELLVDAFQPLLTSTGSVTESMRILNLALDVAAGTGRSVAEVSQDLALAYTGVTRGLRKYNLGLSQAELQAKSFEEIQALLAKQFSGSSAAFLETYAGKMAVLAESAGLASEIIGESLVDALTALTGATSAKSLGDFLIAWSKGFKEIMLDVEKFAWSIKWMFNPKNWLKSGDDMWLEWDKALAKRQMANARAFDPNNNAVTGYKVDEAASRKAAKDAARRASDLLKAQKKNTQELVKQNRSKRQSALFDIEQIGLVAALQGKLSDDERLRARLQLALLVGNTDQAQRLSDRLADSIDKTGALKEFINTLPDAPNPFAAWDEWLKNFAKNLAAVTGTPTPNGSGGVTPPPPSSNAGTFDDSMRIGALASLTRKESFTDADFDRAVNITLQIDGKTIASAMQDQSLSGNNTSVSRTLGGFAGFM